MEVHSEQAMLEVEVMVADIQGHHDTIGRLRLPVLAQLLPFFCFIFPEPGGVLFRVSLQRISCRLVDRLCGAEARVSCV